MVGRRCDFAFVVLLYIQRPRKEVSKHDLAGLDALHGKSWNGSGGLYSSLHVAIDHCARWNSPANRVVRGVGLPPELRKQVIPCSHRNPIAGFDLYRLTSLAAL